jgi:hypothetical protein
MALASHGPFDNVVPQLQNGAHGILDSKKPRASPSAIAHHALECAMEGGHLVQGEGRHFYPLRQQC